MQSELQKTSIDINKGQSSIWRSAFKYALIPWLIVALVTIVYALSEPQSSPGQGQQGLIFIVAPFAPAFVPVIYVADLLKLGDSSDNQITNLVWQILFLFFVALYYFLGLLIAYIVQWVKRPKA